MSEAKPREYFAYYAPDEDQLKAGGNYGCTDGWKELTLVPLSAYQRLQSELEQAILERDLLKREVATLRDALTYRDGSSIRNALISAANHIQKERQK